MAEPNGALRPMRLPGRHLVRHCLFFFPFFPSFFFFLALVGCSYKAVRCACRAPPAPISLSCANWDVPIRMSFRVPISSMSLHVPCQSKKEFGHALSHPWQPPPFSTFCISQTSIPPPRPVLNWLLSSNARPARAKSNSGKSFHVNCAPGMHDDGPRPILTDT
ncbi:uncharacterized protein IWZ02DRAFT_292462 [Phyllosticta citriasiana]|uniref:uncharacterized protein n=1 Tax=Phyllosticta citriasiana TaxID=595635 RepID=UPI0030FDE690